MTVKIANQIELLLAETLVTSLKYINVDIHTVGSVKNIFKKVEILIRGLALKLNLVFSSLKISQTTKDI